MARQTFEKGQTVYCHRYGGAYRKAIVAQPDIVKKSFAIAGKGQRNMHYVGVIYVNHQGAAEGSEWPIQNTIRAIISEEAYNAIKTAKYSAELRSDIRAYTRFEEDFLRYFEQAEIICRTLLGGHIVVEPSEVSELAHYLRGMFAFASQYSRMDREGVRTLRQEKRATAAIAHNSLVAMGEEAPELVKEAGA